MENVNKNYNQLSDVLRAELKKAMPKPGQVIWFESSRPKARGTTILGFDRIWDPGANNGEGDYIDIAYLPSSGTDPKKSRIHFTISQMGKIGIHGGNKADELKFAFLYLTNVLKNNVGKPWYIQPVGGIMCRMLEPSQSAVDRNELRRKVRYAGDRIDGMPDGKLFDFAIGLEMKGINKHSNPEEIRDQLFKIAEKDPEKILALDRNIEFKAKTIIRKAEQFGIVKRDAALGMLVWSDTSDPICAIPPDKNIYDSLVKFFLDKGAEVYSTIHALVDKKEAALEAKTAEHSDNPPPPKNKGGRPKGSIKKKITDGVV